MCEWGHIRKSICFWVNTLREKQTFILWITWTAFVVSQHFSPIYNLGLAIACTRDVPRSPIRPVSHLARSDTRTLLELSRAVSAVTPRHLRRHMCKRIGSIIEQAVILFQPIFTCPVHSSYMPHFTIGPCTGQSTGSARRIGSCSRAFRWIIVRLRVQTNGATLLFGRPYNPPTIRSLRQFSRRLRTRRNPSIHGVKK